LLRITKKHRELKKFVGKRKNLSVSAPSEQFSTSVLAEQLSVIEVSVKKLHVVYAANNNFYGGASPRSPRGSYATANLVNKPENRCCKHPCTTACVDSCNQLYV